MNVAVIQSHIMVGDFAGNAKRLLAAYNDAVKHGAEIVVAQEAFLSFLYQRSRY